MLAPLHLILCHHFQAFVLFDILCASYHIAGTRKLQLWELGMLEELNRQRGRDQTSHYTHPRAREDSQVLPFATQQHSSHQVYHHLEQMGLFAKPAENKYFFLAWGNFHINSLHIHMTCRHCEGEAGICEWGQRGKSRLYQVKLKIKLHPKSPVTHLNLSWQSSEVLMGCWITEESIRLLNIKRETWMFEEL